jgi:hypothetical protein
VSDDIVGCTIVARNYVPYARVLADGWRRHHHGLPLYVLVIDEDDGPARGAGLEVVSPADLGLPAAELSRLRGIYSVAELTTALKPHLLRVLLDEGADCVVFLDSDTDIHASVHHVGALAARHGIALSTHLLEPPPRDGLSPSEQEQGKHGVFNSGFLAVGQASRAFLDWWTNLLRRDCLFCDPVGMHADQRWLDFVPSYFDHHVLRDPGVNVAQWNAHERRIHWDGGSFRVNGGPLRTFHFAGFDPKHPEQPSTYGWLTPLRLDMPAEPDLLRLCREYGQKLLAAGYEEFRRIPYRFATTAAGRPLGTWERWAYRELLLAAEAKDDRDLPDPFDPARSAEFERMLDQPWTTGLLSDAAASRLKDARDAAPVAWRHVPHPVVLARKFARSLSMRRHPWTPHPLPSDRTLLEYVARAHRP